MKLPRKIPWDMAQTRWAADIDPVLNNLLVQGQLLTNIQLINGVNVVNHKLGRQILGWFLVSPKSAAVVFEAPEQPNPTLTLTLNSNASISTGIWVF